MRWTQHIAAPSSRRTVPNSAHKELCLIYWLHLRKIFWPLFSYLHQKLCWPSWPFSATFTTHMRWDFLVCRGFCDPSAPSLAQAILCWTDAPRNSRHNHANTPDIFAIMCIFCLEIKQIKLTIKQIKLYIFPNNFNWLRFAHMKKTSSYGLE